MSLYSPMVKSVALSLWLLLPGLFTLCCSGQTSSTVSVYNLTCISRVCEAVGDQRPESFKCRPDKGKGLCQAVGSNAFCAVSQMLEPFSDPVRYTRSYTCLIPDSIVHYSLTCASGNKTQIKYHCCQSNFCNNITDAPYLRMDEPANTKSPSEATAFSPWLIGAIVVAVSLVVIALGLCAWTATFCCHGRCSITTLLLSKKSQGGGARWSARDADADATLALDGHVRHQRPRGAVLTRCFQVPSSSEPCPMPHTAVSVPRAPHSASALGSVSQSRTLNTPHTCSTQLPGPSPFHSGMDGWSAEQMDGGVCAMSSSGSGLPILEKRTVSREIVCVKLIGTGRYGSVYMGHWRDDQVAVKKFHSFEYEAFKHEADLYLTCMLFHTNILRFIAIDSKDCVHCTEHWLITEYHANGSLCTYLTSECVTVQQMLRLALSAATGLAHLHQTFNGQAAAGAGVNASKPRIAHRDLKSHNILVKNDLTCAIGDLGAAITYDQHCAFFRNRSSQPLTPTAVASRFRVGTRRYLAPEVLDDSIHYANFEALLAADVYSFALVLWELLHRTRPRPDAGPSRTSLAVSLQESSLRVSEPSDLPNDSAVFPSAAPSFTDLLQSDDEQYVCPEYALPYHELADRDPSEENMRQIVCVQRIRPLLHPRVLRDPVIASAYNTLCECWCTSPDARLSAPRIKRRLRELADQLGVVAN